MMTIMRPQLLLLVLPRVLAALLPRQTDPVLDGFDIQGRSPMPTALPDLTPAFLYRRAGGTIVKYVAPDNTCGFISGIRTSSVTCPPGDICVGHHNENGEIGAGGCSNTFYHDVRWQGYCVNSEAMSRCSGVCLTNTNILRCTHSAVPWCNPYSIPGINAAFYLCGPVKPGTSTTIAYTSYQGQADGDRTWIPVYHNPPANSTMTRPTHQTSAAALPANSGSSVPIGAIVGGAVGGFAVLCLLIGAIVFFCLRSRRRARQANDGGVGGVGVGPGTPGAPSMAPTSPTYAEYPEAVAGSPGGYYFQPDHKQSQVVADVNQLSPPASPPPPPAQSLPAHNSHASWMSTTGTGASERDDGGVSSSIQSPVMELPDHPYR